MRRYRGQRAQCANKYVLHNVCFVLRIIYVTASPHISSKQSGVSSKQSGPHYAPKMAVSCGSSIPGIVYEDSEIYIVVALRWLILRSNRKPFVEKEKKKKTERSFG